MLQHLILTSVAILLLGLASMAAPDVTASAADGSDETSTSTGADPAASAAPTQPSSSLSATTLDALQSTPPPDPTSPEYRADFLYELSLQHLQAARLDSAIVVLSYMIHARPEDERAYRMLTRIYSERDKLWEAFRYFEGLGRRYDDLAAPLVAMGEIEMMRDHPERAMPIFENAVRREKHHQGALGGFARAKVQAGEAPAAFGYFEKLLHSEPAAAGYRYGKAVALAENGDYQAAATQFKWAIQLDRTSWLAERDYGRMLVPYGKLDLAIKHLGRAIEILDAERDPATAGELRVEWIDLQNQRGSR